MSVTIKAGEHIPRPFMSDAQEQKAEEAPAPAPAEKKTAGRRKKAAE